MQMTSPSRATPHLNVQSIPLDEVRNQLHDGQLVYVLRYGCVAFTDKSGIYTFYDLGEKRAHNSIPHYLGDSYEVVDLKTGLTHFPYHIIQSQWSVYVHGTRRSRHLH